MTTAYIDVPPVFPVPPLAPGFRDDFATAGNLNGRTGWLAQARTGFSSQLNAVAAANGAAGGTTGGGMYVLTAAAVPLATVQSRMGVSGMAPSAIADHVTVSGTATLISMDAPNAVISNVPTGNFYVRTIINSGAATTIGAFGFVWQLAGDVVRREYYTSGADTRLAVFLNGWPIGPQGSTDPTLVVSGLGITLTGQYGMIGNTGATTLDDITVTDPTTQSWIGLVDGNRIVAVNSDGSATFRFKVKYGGPVAPTELRYTIFDRSTGVEVPLTGHDDAVLSFTIVDGHAVGFVTVAAALLASGGPFVPRARWPRMRTSSLLFGGSAFATGPRKYVGDIYLQNGQSLGVNVARQNITVSSWTPFANSTWLNGEPTSQAVAGATHTRYLAGLGTNTVTAAFGQTLSAVTNRPCTRASGGVSAQPIANRGVGTACQSVIKETIDRAGGRIHGIFHTDGQSDVNDPVAYLATFLALYGDLDTYAGYQIPVLIDPVAASWYGSSPNDQRWQNMRRTQWQLTQDYPTRFFMGAHTLDLQHFDTLHLNTETYAEFARRQAWAALRQRGLSTFGRNGPSLASVQRISATEIRCVFDLNGFDSLELANTAYQNLFNGGMTFSTAPTFANNTIATKILATGAIVDAAPSGGQQGINFTFPANSFPGMAYVWAAFGQNPFNPLDTGSLTDPVNLDIANRGSMIRGLKSGEPPVALRPRFTSDGLDYMIAA